MSVATNPEPAVIRTAADLPDFLTARQVADYSGYCYHTVLRAMRSGQLRATQYGPNCSWRVYNDDMVRWLQGLRPAPAVRTLRSVPRR